MVSRSKAKHYSARLADIQSRLLAQVDKQYPKIETSYRDLIAAGAGRMRSEKEIRRACGMGSRYSCPPTVEILDLFDIKLDREIAESKALAREEERKLAKDVIATEMVRAKDLLQFGTDEQLLAKLEELEGLIL